MIVTKKVLNQNISAEKRIRSIFKIYQKQETIFVNLVSCFLVRKNATIKETRRKIIVSIGDDDVSDKNIKDNILEATIQAFQKKGLKFTMDDITSLLGISKKTI